MDSRRTGQDGLHPNKIGKNLDHDNLFLQLVYLSPD
jgi:hypothetical protein